MSNPLYLNGIPSSLVGYGTQRQQFQSYDGVLSTVSTYDEATLDTLEKQLNTLTTKVDTLQNTLAGYGITNSSQGTLSVTNVSTTNLDATSATIGTNTSNTITIKSDTGTGIVMNGKPIRMGISTDDVNVITYNNYGGGILDVKGNYGGALAYNNNGTRNACLDWGSGRIRSPLTFQSGIRTGGYSDDEVSFPIAFKTVPTVVASMYGNVTNLLSIRITSVSTTKFTYSKRYVDSYGNVGTSNENFGWIAFDPTNTSLF